MALFEPEPGGPRNLRELYHWVFGQLGRIDIGGGGGGVPIGTCLKTELARISASDGSFSFSPLPADTYDRYIIQGTLRSNHTTTDGVRIYLNGDSTPGNYHYQNIWGNNGGTQGNDNPDAFVELTPGNDAVVGNEALIEIVIEKPNGPQRKVAMGKFALETVNGIMYTGHRGVQSDITAAINAILLSGTSGALTGTLVLYGEKTV